MFYVSTYSTDPAHRKAIRPGPFIATRNRDHAMQFAKDIWTLPGGKAVVYQRGPDGLPLVVWRAA